MAARICRLACMRAVCHLAGCVACNVSTRSSASRTPVPRVTGFLVVEPMLFLTPLTAVVHTPAPFAPVPRVPGFTHSAFPIRCVDEMSHSRQCRITPLPVNQLSFAYRQGDSTPQWCCALSPWRRRLLRVSVVLRRYACLLSRVSRGSAPFPHHRCAWCTVCSETTLPYCRLMPLPLCSCYSVTPDIAPRRDFWRCRQS